MWVLFPDFQANTFHSVKSILLYGDLGIRRPKNVLLVKLTYLKSKFVFVENLAYYSELE